jgi:hypothetical protein
VEFSHSFRQQLLVLAMWPSTPRPRVNQGPPGKSSQLFELAERDFPQCRDNLCLPLIPPRVRVFGIYVLSGVLQSGLNFFQIVRLFSNVLDLIDQNMSPL